MNNKNTSVESEVNDMNDVEKVKMLFEEVKKTFNEASDEDARKILKEIQYFQRIQFSM
jgi:hypothetical protein